MVQKLTFSLLKAYKEERDSVMKELETLREKVKIQERDATIVQETFKQYALKGRFARSFFCISSRREIQELLLDNQQVREEVYVAQGRAVSLRDECDQLKRQLTEADKRTAQKQSALDEIKSKHSTREIRTLAPSQLFFFRSERESRGRN